MLKLSGSFAPSKYIVVFLLHQLTVLYYDFDLAPVMNYHTLSGLEQFKFILSSEGQFHQGQVKVLSGVVSRRSRKEHVFCNTNLTDKMCPRVQ